MANSRAEKTIDVIIHDFQAKVKVGPECVLVAIE